MSDVLDNADLPALRAKLQRHVALSASSGNSSAPGTKAINMSDTQCMLSLTCSALIQNC